MSQVMKGKVRITGKGPFPGDVLSAITIQLGRDNLSHEVVMNPNKAMPIALSIDIIELGDISDEQIKRLLEVIFKDKKNIRGIDIRLAHEDKVFELPYHSEECIDWFIIED